MRRGRAQLKTLKKDFDYPVVPLVFTSPMKRATETAEILFPGVRQIELDDLREMAFGKFEGRAVQELVKDRSLPSGWTDEPHGARGRGGPADVLQPHVVDADEDV